jgi:L-fuconate dehydratase
VLAVLLLAAKFEVPVCPHAGGVGLCELTQHLSVLDHVAISADLEGRRLEYVDHLHEHFVDPVRIRDGRYLAPTAPGYSAQMHEASLAEHAFPGGAAWAS